MLLFILLLLLLLLFFGYLAEETRNIYKSLIKVNSWNSTNSWSPCFNLLNKQMTQTNRYTLTYLHVYKYLSISTYIRMLYIYKYVYMYVYNYLCNVFVVQRKINKAQWYVWLINFRKKLLKCSKILLFLYISFITLY